MKTLILLAPFIVGMVSCRLNMNSDDMNQSKDRFEEKVEELNDMDKRKLLSRELQGIYRNKQNNKGRLNHFRSDKRKGRSVDSEMKACYVPGSTPFEVICEDDTGSRCYVTGLEVGMKCALNHQCKSDLCHAGICRPKYKISVFLRSAVVCDEDTGWNDSDPYAKLELDVRGHKEIKTSKVVHDKDSATFDQWIHWPIFEEQDDNEKFMLKMHFLDWDKRSGHDNLGYYQHYFDLKPTDKWYNNQRLHGTPCNGVEGGHSRVTFRLIVEEV